MLTLNEKLKKKEKENTVACKNMLATVAGRLAHYLHFKKVTCAAVSFIQGGYL